MAININTVSEKLFNILKGFGYEVKSYNKEGKLVINPQEATRFAVAEPNLLARIDVNDKTIVLATSNDLSESPVRGMVKNLAQDYLLNFDYRVFDKKLKPKGENVDIAKNAEKDMAEVMEEINIIRKLSGLDPVEEKVEKDKKYGDEGEKVKTAKGNIYTWAEADRDYSMYGKFTYEGGEFTMHYDPQMGQFDNREPIEGDPKAQQVIDSLPDEYFANDEKETVISGIIDMILEYADPQTEDKEQVAEASLGKMTGSRKSSYQPLADNVKIIVRHNKDVNEEVRGARSRNIHSILIQRGEEKFKMAENNLSAARAMARHLHNGGETYDEIGESITQMSKDLNKLKEFVNYVRKTKLVNETNEEFVSLAIENINDIKTNFKKLSGVKTYANAVETVTNYNNVELLQDDLDLESKFTETHFDDKVANVLDNLKVMASKKHAFETYITDAIQKESFEDLKNNLKESDLVDFATPNAKLGYQVSQLGYSAKDSALSNYLQSIGTKLSDGGQLNQSEYGAIKSCLLSAGQHNVQSAPMSMEESYEAFLDRFVE
jgi:hypothetical protein